MILNGLPELMVVTGQVFCYWGSEMLCRKTDNTTQLMNGSFTGSPPTVCMKNADTTHNQESPGQAPTSWLAAYKHDPDFGHSTQPPWPQF